MMRSLFSGVSGLKTHQTKMDVIGNNISNVNTVAFKSSSTTFSDIMYQTTSQASGATTTRGGTNAKQIGLGVTNGATKISITSSGAAQSTGDALDIRLTDSNSTNFFVVSNGSENLFTRAGSFYIDGAGNLAMTTTGYFVMGWQVDPDDPTIIKKDTVSKLQVMSEANKTSNPEATTLATMSGIIDKNDTSVTSDDGYIKSLTLYDSEGYSYTAKFSIKLVDGTKGQYSVELTSVLDDQNHDILQDYTDDGGKLTDVFGPTQTATVGDSATTKWIVQFDTSDGTFKTLTEGVMADADLASLTDTVSTATLHTRLLGINNASTDTQSLSDIEIDFSQLMNYDNGGTSTVKLEKGDIEGTTGTGKKTGTMTGLSISSDGTIYGSYSNGNTVLLGQICVAQFANASGLEELGDNCYGTTLNSGDFDGIGIDISADGSSMSTGQLEMSNVDLSSEFTNMIITQRGFQANSRIITVSDTLLEELINLKR